MKKKHIVNIAIIFAISILITTIFDRIYGGGNVNYFGLVLNVLYGVIIGGSISLSGLVTKLVFRVTDVEQYPLRAYIILLVSIFIYITADVIVVNALWYRFTHNMSFGEIFTNTGIIISTIMTIFIGLTIFFIILSKKYITLLLNAEKEIQNVKHDADKAKFETLKSQINPHFLFNSLNSLSALIHIDVAKADEFTNKLSSIYRYILDHQDDELVSLKDEISFIESYASLQAIRFDDNFILDITDIENYSNKLIVPLSLQLLLENVFKHNVISSKNIITITIRVSDNYIVVGNNKNLKSNTGVSHNVGLKNIFDRYQLICDKKCSIEDLETEFIVKLPLLEDN